VEQLVAVQRMAPRAAESICFTGDRKSSLFYPQLAFPVEFRPPRPIISVHNFFFNEETKRNKTQQDAI
jgi:hypothetical protein